MPAQPLIVVEGSRRSPRTATRFDIIKRSVNRAIDAGYLIGQRVQIGHISGQVVGYNIGHYGRFCGTLYPLLVRTEYGVTKCRLCEVTAA